MNTRAARIKSTSRKSLKNVVKSAPKKGVNFVKRHIVEFDYNDFFKSLLWAIVIALIFRTMLFEPYRIPSGSMIPNLLVGDYLFVSKYSYGYSKHSLPFSIPIFDGRIMSKTPERGDIIVFKGAKDPDTYYIKRLVGLPGDTIQIKKSVLYINDREVQRTKAGNYQRIGRYGEHINYTEYMETLPNGIKYKVLDANENHHRDFPDQTIKYTVPKNNFFFMGDNRNHSVDSRYLKHMGFIPFDNLVGKAEFLFWTDDFSILDLATKLKTGRAFKVVGNEN